MRITHSGGQTTPGSTDWFTGTVFLDAIRTPDEQTAIGAAHVRFTPGARTAWHKHPKGQTLYVTDGIGYVARRGGEVQEIPAAELVPGDIVLMEAGDRVPADGRFLLANSLSVDESTLTGESVPVDKTADVVDVDESDADADVPLAERLAAQLGANLFHCGSPAPHHVMSCRQVYLQPERQKWHS